MKKVIIFCMCFLITINAYAQTLIKLKDGTSVEGKVVEKTDDYIKIDVFGATLTYWMDEIENINFEVEPQLSTKREVTSNGRQQETSQNSEDAREIKKVIKEFFWGFASQDIDSIMEHISIHYYKLVDERIVDYAEFKSGVEAYINSVLSKHLDGTVTEIKTSNLKIDNNKATAKVECTFGSFDISSAQWISEITNRDIFFSKENGKWKIVQLDKKNK